MVMSPELAVPEELKELLHRFVVGVIRDQVHQAGLVDYGVKFFAELKKNQKGRRARHSWWDTGRHSHADLMEHHDGQEQHEHEPVGELPVRKHENAKIKRRHSVSAEVYDPSKEIHGPTPVIPKKPKEIEILTKVTKEVLLFRALDAEAINQVVDALTPLKVPPGKDVVVQGTEEANEFYIIESGIFDIYVKDAKGVRQKVGEYNAVGSFGELALMYHQPRAATVTARTAASLWVLDRKTFQRVVLGAAYKKRENYMKAFAKVDFFSELREYERNNICDALVPKTFAAREKVLSEGDKADGMYIVETGEVVVTKMIGGKEKELGKLGPGTYFGELALVTNKPRAATVTAATEVKLAFLDVQAFERLLGPCMDILKRNSARYEKQIAEINAINNPKPK